MADFVEYIEQGWKLVPINEGEKRPTQRGWNREALCLSEPEDAHDLVAAGLAHAYSGTCAIDIDDFKLAYEYLLEHDIDLKALYNEPDAVRLTSGRKNRGKLIYLLPDPLASVKIIEKIDGVKTNIVDFRCATAAGYTVQDALPPSVHPITNKPYRWGGAGDWSELPELPPEILQFWQQQLHNRDLEQKESSGIELDHDQLAALCEQVDPDTDYQAWLNVGMALHDATAGSREGFEIWNEWSAKGEKYEGSKDLVPHWKSFRGSGITVDYLLMQQTAEADVFEDVTDKAPKPEEKKENKFPAVHINDWVQRPPPKWIVQEILPQADLAMLFGAPGSGKSFFAMDLAMAISSGIQWREKRTENGPVLWIAAEAAGSVRNRALAYAQHNNCDLADSDFHIVGNTPNLSSVDDVRDICHTARAIGPQVIVVDTMVAASGGKNENSGEDMAIILAGCKMIHQTTGALVLLIHHSGKDQSRGARGWSGIKGAMQTELEVTHEDTGERICKIVKQRDGEQDIEYGFRLAPVNLLDFDGIAQNSCAVEPEEGVTFADSDLDTTWASMGFYEFFARATDCVAVRAFQNGIYDCATSCGEDKEFVDESIDQTFDQLTEASLSLITNGEISIVGLIDEII